MRFNIKDLLKIQIETHKCKKNEKCVVCGKEVCDLCACFVGIDFKAICYECEPSYIQKLKVEQKYPNAVEV